MGMSTKRGDGGETDIFIDGKLSRMAKSEAVFDVLGNLDELNSFIGVAKNHTKPEFRGILERTQKNIVIMGGLVAKKPGVMMGDEEVKELEKHMKRIEEELGELKGFVYPGGSEASTYLDVCRAVCRRIERDIVRMNRKSDLDPMVMKYLNRLSDLLFLMARVENKERGFKESGSWEN
jgi:cob(I)alamin adenosyltransferase